MYLVWPAFYCDVTDAYRLGRAGRLRTDLGGIYFNLVFAVAAAACHFVTGVEAFLLVIMVQHVIVLQQLIPLLRFDGYYVLTDLTGVPDILSRIKPIFARSSRAGRPRVGAEAVGAGVVTAYLVALVPTLAFLLVLDRDGRAADVRDRLRLARPAARPHPRGVRASRGGAWRGPARRRCCCPCLGDRRSASAGRARGAGGLGGWSARAAGPARAVVVARARRARLGFTPTCCGPNGDYEPFRPGERGTIGEALGAIPEYAVGRPVVRATRADGEVGPVPAVPAEGEAPAPPLAEAAEPTPHQTPAPARCRGDDHAGPARRDGAESQETSRPTRRQTRRRTARGDIHDRRTTATPTPGTAHPEPHDRGRVDGDPDAEPQHHGRADRHSRHRRRHRLLRLRPRPRPRLAHRGRRVDLRPHPHFRSPSGSHADRSPRRPPQRRTRRRPRRLPSP